MTATARLTVALAVASAFSAFPSAFYHHVAAATGTTWATGALFTAHGVAGVVAMTVVARPGVGARLVRLRRGRVVAALLAVDVAGAVVMVLAPEPAGFAALLAGRVVTGAALGALTPLVAGVVGAAHRGPALVTAGVLGGVGAGSLVAGLLAAAGLGRAAVLAVGAAALVAAALVVLPAGRTAVPAPGAATAPTAAVPPTAAPAVPARPAGRTLGVWVAAAFVANGLLGLLSSTVPGVVAARAAGSSLVAGATTGTAMLAAGGARLALTPAGPRTVRLTAVGAASAGAAAFTLGLGASGTAAVAALLLGGLLVGAAAGITYDAAVTNASASPAPAARLRGVARVQRGGQLGLVVPVLAASAVAS